MQETQPHYHRSTPHTDQHIPPRTDDLRALVAQKDFFFFATSLLFASFLLQYMNGRTLKLWMNAVLFASYLSLKLQCWSLSNLGEGQRRPGHCSCCLLHPIQYTPNWLGLIIRITIFQALPFMSYVMHVSLWWHFVGFATAEVTPWGKCAFQTLYAIDCCGQCGSKTLDKLFNTESWNLKNCLLFSPRKKSIFPEHACESTHLILQ